MVQLKQDPNKRHYFTEVPANEALEVLRKAIQDKVEVKIWEEGKSEEEVETYLAVQVDEKTLLTNLEHQGGLLSKLFTSKLVGKQVFLKIGSGKFQFFSTADFKQDKSTKSYQFKLTSPLFKTQQRSNYRLQASSQVRIQFRVSEEVLHDALDISAGGTSFIIPKEEQDSYAKGTNFTGCRLGLNSHKFDIPTATVVGQWPAEAPKGSDEELVKIGISFTGLSKDAEEELFKVINSEARAEEMRKAIMERKSKGE
ncbi:MAG: hypothetical protein CME63_10055 [Halobacteriovoraceae bacterium]|jgi:hypothetical protein|nr:hypothetical protein [Halobacteriovoraceae bacterium]MBC98083.1 hypothetical protein [Halobacteriovoraceae bacterium]|tara:strand:- start:80292 stop:81056 length:765 start_codon:yes stop_codon:yes gene_type:complete